MTNRARARGGACARTRERSPSPIVRALTRAAYRTPASASHLNLREKRVLARRQPARSLIYLAGHGEESPRLDGATCADADARHLRNVVEACEKGDDDEDAATPPNSIIIAAGRE